MQISGLNMDYMHNGKATASVWCKCHSVEDCEEIIRWLRMAQANMKQWQKIDAESKANEPER